MRKRYALLASTQSAINNNSFFISGLIRMPLTHAGNGLYITLMFNLLAMWRGSFEPCELIKSKTKEHILNMITIPLEYINRLILLLVLWIFWLFAMPSIHDRHNNKLKRYP